MSKLVILIFSLVVLGALGTLLYFYLQDDLNDILKSKYSNVNVFAYDETQKFQREIGYELWVNDVFYKEGKTIVDGAVLEKIPINSTFYVKSKNLKNQRYYVFKSEQKSSVENQTYRIDMILKNYGVLNISSQGIFGVEENMSLLLTSYGLVKNLTICEKWSFNLLNVFVKNLTESEKPNLYKNYDKCYSFNRDFENENFLLNFNYVKYSNLNSNDFLEFVFIDTDDGTSELNGKDVGAENARIILKI